MSMMVSFRRLFSVLAVGIVLGGLSVASGVAQQAPAIEVRAGQIAVPHPVGESKLGYWQGLENRAVNVAAWLLDLLVPSAQAADLTASSDTPTVNFEDTDTLPPLIPDWKIQVSDSNAGGSFSIQDDDDGVAGSLTNPPTVTLRRGTNSGNTIDLQANGDLFLVNENVSIIRSTGQVGIGTTAPVELVDVEQVEGASRFQLTSITSTTNEAAQFVQRRALITGGGDLAAVTAFSNLGIFSFRGYNGNGFTASKAGIGAQTTENWTPTANGTRILFSTTPNGSTTLQTVMEITQDAKVKINGTTLNVPDYVFEDDYPLMPLEELKAYVKKEKHLPKVASADQVDKDKMIDLGGNQMVLLEKVEELVLYTIQQHEQIKKQQEELDQLREQNEALRAVLETRLTAIEQQVAGLNALASK